MLGSSSTDEAVSTQVESCGCTPAFITGWDMVWELMSNKFAAPAASLLDAKLLPAAGYGHVIDAHVLFYSLIDPGPAPSYSNSLTCGYTSSKYNTPELGLTHNPEFGFTHNPEVGLP